MVPADEFAFESNHHNIKISLGGEVEANLNSEVPGSFAGGDPLETFVPTPLPSFFFFARLDGSEFVPVYFCS
jgi:hypothetical protein